MNFVYKFVVKNSKPTKNILIWKYLLKNYYLQ
jgi:hypothetical protein